jgi:hypothetical protein
LPERVLILLVKNHMKHLPVLLAFLLVVFPQSSRAKEANVTAELSNLNTQYDRAVEQALEPLTKKYLDALNELKLKYTKAGRLDDAIAVDEVIKGLTKVVTPPNNAVLEDILKRNIWTYTAGSHASEIQFLADGAAKMTGWSNDKLQWNVTQNRFLTIIYSDGNSCKFDFVDRSHLDVTGTVNDRNKSTRRLSAKGQTKRD